MGHFQYFALKVNYGTMYFMDTKVCGRCKIELPVDSFRIRNKKTGSRQSYCIECNKEKNKEHYQQNKDTYKLNNQLRGTKQEQRHRLTTEDLEKLKAKHNGMCWSCKERPGVVVDHDHTCCSGYTTCGNCIRGILCKKCNTGIGLLGDSIEGLQQALDYLAHSFSG